MKSEAAIIPSVPNIAFSDHPAPAKRRLYPNKYIALSNDSIPTRFWSQAFPALQPLNLQDENCPSKKSESAPCILIVIERSDRPRSQKQMRANGIDRIRTFKSLQSRST